MSPGRRSGPPEGAPLSSRAAKSDTATIAPPADRGAEQHPAKRYEWLRIVRRCRLGPTAKAVAVVLSTYSNLDGSNIFPGRLRLAAVLEKSPSTVDRALKLLRDIGLIERVSEGSYYGRRAVADRYRLTIPSDLLEVVELLDPDEMPAEDQSAPVQSDPAGTVSTHDNCSPPESDGTLVTGAREHSSNGQEHSSPVRRSLVTHDEVPDHNQTTDQSNDHSDSTNPRLCRECDELLRTPASRALGICAHCRQAVGA